MIGSPPTALATVKIRLSIVPAVPVVAAVAMTLPLTSIEDCTSDRPAKMASLPRSVEKVPAERMVKAKTEATTTKAIKMIAVSKAVMPSSSWVTRCMRRFK